MIRQFEPRDVPKLVEIGMRTEADFQLTKDTKFDENSLFKYGQMLTSNDLFRTLVSEIEDKIVGFIIVIISPYFANQNIWIGQHLNWWVDPKHPSQGKELLNEMEKWLKHFGCKFFIVHRPEKFEKLSKFYERNGFKPHQQLFLKEL